METVDVSMYAVALAPVALFVTSFLKKRRWSHETNTAISLLVSMGLTLGLNVLSGDVDSWKDITANFAVLWATTQAIYSLYFEKTGLNQKLTDIGS